MYICICVCVNINILSYACMLFRSQFDISFVITSVHNA